MHCADAVTPPRCQAFDCAWSDTAYSALGITHKMSTLLPATVQSCLCLLVEQHYNACMR